MPSPNSRHGRHRIRRFTRVTPRPVPIELRVEDEEARLQAHLDAFEGRVRAARYGRIVDEPARSPRGERGVIID
jgi:hypothetical protein